MIDWREGRFGRVVEGVTGGRFVFIDMEEEAVVRFGPAGVTTPATYVNAVVICISPDRDPDSWVVAGHTAVLTESWQGWWLDD